MNRSDSWPLPGFVSPGFRLLCKQDRGDLSPVPKIRAAGRQTVQWDIIQVSNLTWVFLKSSRASAQPALQGGLSGIVNDVMALFPHGGLGGGFIPESPQGSPPYACTSHFSSFFWKGELLGLSVVIEMRILDLQRPSDIIFRDLQLRACIPSMSSVWCSLALAWNICYHLLCAWEVQVLEHWQYRNDLSLANEGRPLVPGFSAAFLSPGVMGVACKGLLEVGRVDRAFPCWCL